MIVRRSEEQPRWTLLRRFPVPKGFHAAPKSRIQRGREWPAPEGATNVKRLQSAFPGVRWAFKRCILSTC